MTKEEIIAKFKQDRSIKDSYKLSEDEEYFINIIFELQKEIPPQRVNRLLNIV